MMQRRCYWWGQTRLMTVAGVDCIACLENLGSMANGLLIWMMAQHLVAKP